MISMRLDKKIEVRLERLAKRTGRTKSYYIKKAIVELLEDQEDYEIALARLEEGLPSIPFAQIEKELGLDR